MRKNAHYIDAYEPQFIFSCVRLVVTALTIYLAPVAAPRGVQGAWPSIWGLPPFSPPHLSFTDMKQNAVYG